MICIFSDFDDNYTHKLIEWLNFYNCEFVKVDLFKETEHNFKITLGESNKILLSTHNGLCIDLNNISYFFYRSGNIIFNKENIKNQFLTKKLSTQFLQMEFDTLVDYIYFKIKSKCLGWLDQKPLNKLIQLDIAKKYKLKIPETFITSTKTDFKKKFSTRSCITKAIQENIGIQTEKQVYIQRVKEVTFNELTDYFYPSLFQERIAKKLEIRSFYLDGKFYSIAFKNISKNLSIDMRDNYSMHDNFRFDLPSKIKSKLKSLMKELNLVIGSIDLILDVNNDFYFLEINPEGQYEWLSEFGGHNIDQRIAKFLVKKDNNE